MKERAIKKVLASRQAKINQAQLAAERKLAAALSIPEIAATHEKYVDLKFKAAMRGSDGTLNVQSALDEYHRALSAHGISEQDFVYIPTCPICKDTGNMGGKACKCVWNEYIAALKQECRIEEKAPFTFESCDTHIVKNNAQRAQLDKIYAWMKAYSQKLPNVKLKNIVLSGNVGTGKTCLASAVAREAVERGKSCKFMSAFEFNNEMLAAHTSPIAERNAHLHDVLTADLLVIDDLGTEPHIRNVTVEYLLLVLEERLINKQITIITTNLNADRIMSQYSERIYSRLTDKSNSLFVELSGDDLRHS
ncbi:MAG: ATP-binding protein [Clostridia bacterium]|nr:ATP-binding protein [Clostridia bacterium]